MNGCERRYSLLGGFLGGALLFGFLVHRFMTTPIGHPSAVLTDEEVRVRYMTNRRSQP